jgi:glutaconyl-CoA decarboxylase
MHQPATTNPLIIMCINMTIVFAVLIGLSFMIKFIHMIDPTKPKEKKEEAPKAAPAAPAAAAPAAPAVDPNLNIAVIAAAVAAYGGDAKIVAIRPIESAGWKSVGRANGVQNTVF